MLKVMNKAALQNNKIALIYQIQRLTLVILTLVIDVSILCSIYDAPHRLVMLVAINGVFLLTISGLTWAKHHIKQQQLLTAIFAGTCFFIALLVLMLTRDRSTMTMMFLLGPLTMMLFINFEKRYILGLGAIYLVSNLVFSFLMPSFEIRVGFGFYILNMGMIVISVVVALKGMDMFSAYERLIQSQIEEMRDQNVQLIASNEELIASEEEVREQYNQIAFLLDDNTQLLDKLSAIFDASDDGIIDIHKKTGRVIASPNAQKILNESFERDMDFLEIFKRHLELEEAGQFELLWMEFLQHESHSQTREIAYTVHSKVKILKLNLISYTSQKDQTAHVVIVVKDITAEYNQAQHIYRMAYVDSLTNLMNRQSFIEESQQLLETCTDWHMILFDIDNFKYINESFGFYFGDQLLVAIANRLKQSHNNRFKLLARLSGDEFACIVEHQLPVLEVLSWLQTELRNFTIETIDLAVNYSIGIANSSGNTYPADILLKQAEIAMYKAKERGKKRYFFYTDLLMAEVDKKHTLLRALENAVADHELFLQFQPTFDAQSQSCTGFEALARWNSKHLGSVSPSEFILLAEKSGLIHDIGRFVMAEAMGFAKRVNSVRSMDDVIKITINISAVQLLSADFYDEFISMMTQMKISPSWIGIEITETVVMENRENVALQLSKFRAYGIQIYLDDFGSGYSSLNYLTELPFDVLKIDKSFIDAIGNRGREYQVVGLIINLAKVFGLKIVAEGVETEEQFTLLRDLGCHVIQGYYFSKPLMDRDALLLLDG